MNAPPLADTQLPVAAPSVVDRLLAIACHLSLVFGLGTGTLVPFIVWLICRRRRPLVEVHARAALNFHLSLIFYVVLACLVLFFTVGFSAFTGMAHGQFPVGLAGLSVLVFFGVLLLIAAGTVAAFILAIIAAIRASDAEPYRYPFTFPIFN